ncbi:MAG: cache domain-containing protein [Desulfofustis sp.]|nr:cache domain-containing protein [Desulfofustis sp.]
MEEISADDRSVGWLKFVVGIILPTVLVIVISVVSIYAVIIPVFRETFLDSKRDMIRELVNVAWSVTVLYEQQERAGLLTRAEAQQRAMEEIEHLRYGREGRDYFWISDLQPRLVMHPYSKELIGSDLSFFEDAGGKRLFMEIKEALSTAESGFIDYIWNKKYAELVDVPKLSYVRKFEPWGWVIGTGVFLDDVEQKTGEITRRLTRMIHIGMAAIALLLALTVLRSLLIERKRRSAEESLRLSRVKYKTLVEAAADPIMMLHNGTCLYANKGMEDLLGYGIAELETMNLSTLVAGEGGEREQSLEVWENALHGYVSVGRHEIVLKRKDGRLVTVLVTMARKNLGSQKVVVLTARDIQSSKRLEEELGQSRERFRQLADRLRIGMFRTTAGGGFKILEANEVTRELLEQSGGRPPLEANLLDFFADANDRQELVAGLLEEGLVKEKSLILKENKGFSRTVSISMVLVKDGDGSPLYCDGLLEDISRRQQSEEERENLIVELQTSLMFLNQPVRSSLSGFISCDLNTPIRKAARMMSEADRSAILIASESGAMIGIVTDLVLRERVVGGSIALDAPIYQIMSAPLIYIDDSALIFEAVLLLQERGIKHLVVRDAGGAATSVISNEELLDVHRYSSSFVLEQIRSASSVAAIGVSLKRLPRIIKALIDSGAHAENITRVVTTISDTVLNRLLELAIADLGEPPVPFAFVSVGSEGRGEQTLVTDQDNAIIFADIAEDQAAGVHDYFQRLGTVVCTALNEVGYRFCTGNVMAMNPTWCQPLAVWKRYFSEWIGESGPEELMEVSIFFDFRCLYGTTSLTEELREHVFAKGMMQKAFLYQMAQNTLLFKVPIDFFGKLAVESGGDHPDTFNIKHVMAQVIVFARIYAIFHGLESTSTLHRLDSLLDKGVLGKERHAELREAYNYLMQLRLRHQLKRIDEGEEPDNHVSIGEISPMEKELLEKIFSQINQLRKRLSQVGQSEIYF